MKSNTIRFSGLSSQLDTESIVKAMLSPQQLKIDTAGQNKKLLELKKEKWKEMNTKVYGLYTGTLTKLKLTKTFGDTKQSVSNDKAILVDPTSSAYGGTHSIQVKQLAETASLTTGAINKVNVTSLSGSTKVTDLGLVAGDQITLRVDGNPYTVDVTSDMTMSGLKSALASKLTGTPDENLVSISIGNGKLGVSLKDTIEPIENHTLEMIVNNDDAAKLSKLGIEQGLATADATNEFATSLTSHVVNYTPTSPTALATIPSANVTLTNLGFSIGDEITFNANGQDMTVTVDQDTTIASLQTDINKQMTDKGIDRVNFKYDSTLGTFIIGTLDSGSDKSVSMSVVPSQNADGTSKLANLGIKTATDSGQNAQFTYNGGEVLEYNSNNISINGLKCTLLQVTAAGETVQITSTRDTSSMKKFITDFINEYNTLLKEVNDSVYADSIRNYKPLTDEQKEAMSESEIKLWEEKINKGILRNDSVLRNLSDSMQSIMSTTGMTDLGIATGIDYKERGILHINESQLEKMLTENPDKVVETIRSVGTNLYDDIQVKLKGSKDSSANYLFADKSLARDIDDAKDLVNRAEDRFNVLEQMYYKRFTSMETALAKLNSQSSAFTSFAS